jgi:hypothetical protein
VRGPALRSQQVQRSKQTHVHASSAFVWSSSVRPFPSLRPCWPFAASPANLLGFCCFSAAWLVQDRADAADAADAAVPGAGACTDGSVLYLSLCLSCALCALARSVLLLQHRGKHACVVDSADGADEQKCADQTPRSGSASEDEPSHAEEQEHRRPGARSAGTINLLRTITGCAGNMPRISNFEGMRPLESGGSTHWNPMLGIAFFNSLACLPCCAVICSLLPR